MTKEQVDAAWATMDLAKAINVMKSLGISVEAIRNAVERYLQEATPNG